MNGVDVAMVTAALALLGLLLVGVETDLRLLVQQTRWQLRRDRLQAERDRRALADHCWQVYLDTQAAHRQGRDAA